MDSVKGTRNAADLKLFSVSAFIHRNRNVAQVFSLIMAVSVYVLVMLQTLSIPRPRDCPNFTLLDVNCTTYPFLAYPLEEKGCKHYYLADVSFCYYIMCGTSTAYSRGIYRVTLNLRHLFYNHISNILQKSYIRLRLLYSNKSLLNFKIRKKLCESQIKSIFSYCSIVYYPCLDSTSRYRLSVAQNNCARFIFNLRKFTTGLLAYPLISNKSSYLDTMFMTEPYEMLHYSQFLVIPHLFSKGVSATMLSIFIMALNQI
nr:unnamed protein product [Callosobruchus analis]